MKININEPKRKEMYLLTWRPTKTQISLRIRAVWLESSLFAWRHCILGYPKCAQWRFWSECADAQADLNLRWAHMSEGTFSDVADQLYIVVTEVRPELRKTVFPRHLDWFPSNWYINQHENYLYFTKIQSFGLSFSLTWLLVSDW